MSILAFLELGKAIDTMPTAAIDPDLFRLLAASVLLLTKVRYRQHVPRPAGNSGHRANGNRP